MEQFCAVIAVIWVVAFGTSVFQGKLLLDRQGLAAPVDFVSVWAAGQQVLEGHPAAAYDSATHKLAEDKALGRGFGGYVPWWYPPPFLFVAAGLARLPYFVAFAIWMAVTWSIFALVLRGIAGHRLGLLLAAAFPATLWNIATGQTGFLTAALIGGAMLLLEPRPMLSGLCLGILTYKPHFGILFPLILAVAGHWRPFAIAAATGIVMALASWLTFGSAAWEAFFHAMPTAATTALSHGMVNASEGMARFWRLQSLFGFVRTLGGNETTAWVFQITAALASFTVVSMIWRRPVPFELKAAALAVGTLFITPYVFAYDLTILAVPMTFLIRLGLRTGFWFGEPAALGIAAICVFLFPFVKMPVGVMAMLIAAALILRRVCVGERRP